MRAFRILTLMLVACGGTDESVPIDSAGDATVTDGAVDATVDASTDSAAGIGVLCADPGQSCPIPAQACCDLGTGTDTCIVQGASCAGRPLECDGPEDCAAGTECCLFESGSRCISEGNCGFTGSISEVMCHEPTDCSASFPICCGTAPGPVLDLYSTCRTGPCPQ